MTELVAKPIIDNRFWIVTDGQKKVGNIEANNAGYGVNINGSVLQFNNTDEIKNTIQITFDTTDHNVSQIKPYPEYPTPDKIYNSVIDVTRNLHLFTMTPKSKCLHAAGWFAMMDDGSKEVVKCPKYIFIQRYQYRGPFKTKSEAVEALNKLDNATH